jgi:hypothetical protein
VTRVRSDGHRNAQTRPLRPLLQEVIVARQDSGVKTVDDVEAVHQLIDHHLRVGAQHQGEHNAKRVAVELHHVLRLPRTGHPRHGNEHRTRFFLEGHLAE